MSNTVPITHIAGQYVIIDGHRLRQRCGWCGASIIDQDLSLVAVQLEPCKVGCFEGQVINADRQPEDCVACNGTGYEKPGPYPTWPTGGLVRIDGPMRYALDDSEKQQLPEDSCTRISDEVTG